MRNNVTLEEADLEMIDELFAREITRIGRMKDRSQKRILARAAEDLRDRIIPANWREKVASEDKTESEGEAQDDPTAAS